MARNLNRNAKRANKPNPREDRNKNGRNDVNYDSYREEYKGEKPSKSRIPRLKKKIEMIPKTLTQETYINMLEDLEDNLLDILLITGSAGTGKSYLALLASVKALSEGTITKLILCRPAIAVDGEEHGFVPGTLNQKLGIWCAPAFDILHAYFTPQQVSDMIEDGTIELASLGLMRGRNLGGEAMGRVYVVADEFQNSSVSQILMLTTRMQEGSKLIILGDTAQHDRGSVKNGLLDMIEKLNARGGHERIGTCHFSPKDSQRSPLIEDLLKMYGQT